MARSVICAILLTGCWRERAAAPPASSPPPAPLVLEWDGAPGEANPDAAAHALALFSEDEWGRVIPCPRALAAQQPASPARHRCEYPATAGIVVGGAMLWTAEATFDHEFDGMYGSEEGVALLDPANLSRPIATVSQWVLDVVDCRTTLRQRRQRTVDLDADGRAELCVESSAEAGVGLFQVMDLREGGRPWVPNVRTRDIVAFAYDPALRRLRRVPTLDARCPATGYAAFVAMPAEAGDPIAQRRTIQGTPPVAPCPADLAETCFDVCTP